MEKELKPGIIFGTGDNEIAYVPLRALKTSGLPEESPEGLYAGCIGDSTPLSPLAEETKEDPLLSPDPFVVSQRLVDIFQNEKNKT